MTVSSKSKGLDDRTDSLSGEADAHAERAISQSTRLEANLGFLLRGLGDLAAGASAARDVTLGLARELDGLRVLLERSRAEESALRSRVELLERALDAATRRAAEEHSFVVRQQEAFLSDLLAEHERELTALRERLGAGPPSKSTVPPPPDATTPVAALKPATVRIPRPNVRPPRDER